MGGADPSKLVVGMATFGHGWQLADAAENGLFCPAKAGTPPGPYTGQMGFLGYYEVLQAMNNDSLPLFPGATPHAWEKWWTAATWRHTSPTDPGGLAMTTLTRSV